MGACHHLPSEYRPAVPSLYLPCICRRAIGCASDLPGVGARQLDLEPPAMVRGTEQDGLVAQIDPVSPKVR